MKMSVRIVAAGLILGVCAALAGWLFSDVQSTSDAYITGHVHPVAARVTGTVKQLLIDDNQHVHAGDVLVRLDLADFSVRKHLAEAQIAQARAQLSVAGSQIAQARAGILSSQAAVIKARLDLNRASQLVNESPRGISRQEYDAAVAAHDSAAAALEGAHAQLELAQANQLAAQAAIKTGEANREDADLDIRYTDVLAPVDGYIGKRTVETGARIAAGQTLLSIVEDKVWVVANFKETQLKGIAPNARVRLSVDAMPGRVFWGFVDSAAPASGAQFALLPPDNATGNFTKVVQRVPVKILFDRKDLQSSGGQLRPGLSVIAQVRTGDKPDMAGAGEPSSGRAPGTLSGVR